MDASLGIVGIEWLQERFFVSINLHQSIIFPTKHLLLPLLQYSGSVATSFVNILEGFDCVLGWKLDRGRHGCDRDGDSATEVVAFVFEDSIEVKGCVVGEAAEECGKRAGEQESRRGRMVKDRFRRGDTNELWNEHSKVGSRF